VPTLEQQAERQWSNAENLCVVTLVEASLRPTRVERGGRWSIAQAHWQVLAIVSATVKGHCGGGPVLFPELSPAMCGLGMAPLRTPLLAAVDNDASLSWWAPADVPLAIAVRALASAAPPGRRGGFQGARSDAFWTPGAVRQAMRAPHRVMASTKTADLGASQGPAGGCERGFGAWP